MVSKRRLLEQLQLGKRKKEDWIVLGLAGILLIVIALPVQKQQTIDEIPQAVESEPVTNQKVQTKYYGEYWEQRLEKALAQMDGVGLAKVMITLEDEGELIVEKDTPSQTSSTEEKDSGGGTRKIRELASTETTVFYTDENGRQVPYVVREVTPKVTGVVVIAQGADNVRVKEQITRLLEALFDVDAHKVIVVKMKTG